MEKRKTILLASLGITFALTIGTVVVAGFVSNKNQDSAVSKTPYQLYCESHPDYHKSEEEWLQDLVNGNLGDKQKYTVHFNTYGGSSVPDQIVLDGEKINKPQDPEKTGYTFKDWTYKGNTWIFYGFVVTENMTLDANWNINHYKITYDLNGGSVSLNNPNSYTIESEFIFNEPTKGGYSFAGWYDADDNLISCISPGMFGDLDLKAKWNPNKNNLTLLVEDEDKNKGCADVISGSGYSDEETSVLATPYSPYVFKGWYFKGEFITRDNPYTFVMPHSDYQLEAKFDELRHLSLSLSDESKGIISGEGDYIIGEEVSISCNVIKGIFKGWFNNDNELVSSFTQYTFVMPSVNYSLKALFVEEQDEEQYSWNVSHGVIPVFSDDKKTITHGMYPKTVVDDDLLISSLNQLDEPGSSGYYELNGDFYLKKKVSIYNFEYYYGPDVYAPKQFDNGSEMVNGSIEWFKAEPVEWDVLNVVGNKYSLICHNLIEKSGFNNSNSSRLIDGVVIHANNYEYSAVRDYLNGSLYDSIFNLSSEHVVDTEVSNYEKNNPYACKDTIDKMFLPSESELQKLPSELKSAKTTDYLRASGVNYNLDNHLYSSDIWTRTPDAEYKDHVKRYTSDLWVGRCSASLVHCIRPCITIEFI